MTWKKLLGGHDVQPHRTSKKELDDMRALRDAVREYRVAATAAGLDGPDQGASPAGQPPDVVHRIFGVDETTLADLGALPHLGTRAPLPPDRAQPPDRPLARDGPRRVRERGRGGR